MSTICPMCNGIITPEYICICGNPMMNMGPVEDYYGPYSPYYNTSFQYPFCSHLIACAICNSDFILPVPLKKT